MIVADGHQNAAGLRRAGGMSVPDRIARAVNAGPLAIPQRKDAGDAAQRIAGDPLRPGDGGGGEVFVDARHEADVVRGDGRRRAPEFGVDAGERRAAIAADETRGLQPVAPVGETLHHQHAHERLRARREDTSLRPRDRILKPVFKIDRISGTRDGRMRRQLRH